jgi:hypothetical protein
VGSKPRNSPRVGVQSSVPFTESLVWYLNYYPLVLKDDRALLERWLEDERANEVWSVIRVHVEQYEGPTGVDAPMQFIRFILTTKKAAERENEVIPKITEAKAAAKKLLSRLRTEIAEGIRTLPDEKLVPFLESTVAELRAFHPIVTSPPRVRSGKNGSRARTLFIRDVSALVRDVTGKWLDEKVGIITEIAFNTLDIIGVDTVRKARRQTVRKARRQKN